MRPPPLKNDPEFDDWMQEFWQYVNVRTPVIKKVSLIDDAYFDLPESVYGFGFVCSSDTTRWGAFKNTAAAAVTIITDSNGDTLNSASFVGTDTDNNLCVFDNGTNVRVRNRLGSTQEIFILYYYYP